MNVFLLSFRPYAPGSIATPTQSESVSKAPQFVRIVYIHPKEGAVCAPSRHAQQHYYYRDRCGCTKRGGPADQTAGMGPAPFPRWKKSGCKKGLVEEERSGYSEGGEEDIRTGKGQKVGKKMPPGRRRKMLNKRMVLVGRRSIAAASARPRRRGAARPGRASAEAPTPCPRRSSSCSSRPAPPAARRPRRQS